MSTELGTLRQKQRTGKATPDELTRLKVLIDGEPLSKADLEVAKDREAKRVADDKAVYDARHAAADRGLEVTAANTTEGKVIAKELNPPAEHPRIVALKNALNPFTQLEVHDSRPSEVVLIVRGIAITAGDVRNARKAMKL